MAENDMKTVGRPTVQYGPNNPHPSSLRRTELVWEGKYDEYGNRRQVDIAALSTPLQKVETVDEPRARIEAQGNLFNAESAHPDDFRNRLIWGDNKMVAASLLSEFRGGIDLIYIDPPFDVGADFTMRVSIGDGKEGAPKDQSALEMVAYRDMWGRGTDSYLNMLYERLVLVRDLLANNGSVYVHVGPQVNHLVRALLDDVFGIENARREIIWKRVSSRSHGQYYPATHDSILFYSKSDSPTWNQLYEPLNESYVETKYRFKDEDGRRYRKDNCLNQNPNRPNLRYEWNGHVRVWRWKKERRDSSSKTESGN